MAKLPAGYKPRGDEDSISSGALKARLDRFKQGQKGGGSGGGGKKKDGAQGVPQVFSPKLKLDKPGQVLNVGLEYGAEGQRQGNVFANPNQSFAGNAQTYDPVTGQLVRSESDLNRTVREGVQNIGIGANDALYRLVTGGAFGSLTGGGEGAPQSNFENAVFNQLTRGLGEQRTRDTDQLNQEMANRGIPVGSELYNNQMRELNRRYDDQFQGARSQAVQQATNTQLQAIPTLGATGQAGYIDPRFQQFAPVPYNQVDVNALYNTFQQKKMNEAQLALQRQAMAKAGAGGGGGEDEGPSPFSSSPPPGYEA